MIKLTCGGGKNRFTKNCLTADTREPSKPKFMAAPSCFIIWKYGNC